MLRFIILLACFLWAACYAAELPEIAYLPSHPVINQAVIIEDKKGSADARNIAIFPAGGIGRIDGAPSYLLNNRYESAEFVYKRTGWTVKTIGLATDKERFAIRIGLP